MEGVPLPMGLEHVNLTGDYIWRQDKQPERWALNPLRPIMPET